MDIRQLKARLIIRSRQAGPVLVVATLVGSIGVVGLHYSSAESLATNAEAEIGILAGNAEQAANQSGASGSATVRFASLGSGGPRSCPPLPAHPDTSCTGVTPGANLTPSGSLTVTQDGAVIENLSVTGRLTVNANNVIIRNIRLTTTDYCGVMVYGSNLTIEDSTLIGSANTQAPLAAITGSFHALRVDVSGAGDGVTMGNDSSIIDSYVHDLDNSPGEHNDGINADGRLGSRIIHNTVLNANNQTSAVTIGNSVDPSDIVVQDNLLAGGGYTVYAGLGAGVGHGINFENNIFSRQYYPNSGYFGPVAYWQTGNGNSWTGNVYDNGQSVNP